MSDGRTAAPDYPELPLGRFLDLVASGEPAPAGGSVAAVVVALAAGLAGMSARLSTGHLADAPEMAARADELRDRAAPLAREDAEVYGRVMAARRTEGNGFERALSDAADVPLSVAGIGAEVAEVAGRLFEGGNPNLRGDALTAVLLADAATRAAARLAEIDLSLAGIEDERLALAGDLARSVAARRRSLEEGAQR